MDEKELMKEVKEIEIFSHKIINSKIFGDYPLAFRGHGEEFLDLREYYPGDDFRQIDWNATARIGGNPHKAIVKNYQEERGLNIYFGIDLSSSMNFGYKLLNSKKRIALKALGCLMAGAIKHGDKVGFFALDENLVFERSKQYKSIRPILRKMISLGCENICRKTNIESISSKLKTKLEKNSIVIIASDFFPNDYINFLKKLKKEHDVVTIHIIDPNEEVFPKVGYINIEDEETGEQILVQTNDESFQQRYKSRFCNFLRDLKKQFKDNKIERIEIRTNESLVRPLKNFFNIRKTKMVR